VNTAYTQAAGAIVGVTTASTIVVYSTLKTAAATGTTAAIIAAGPKVTTAGAMIIGTVTAGFVVAHLTIQNAYEMLLEELEDRGYDTDLMTEEEIEAVAKTIFNPA